jgi:hypothetical protein
VTLVGWGSTWSVIREAVAQLTRQGIAANQLHFKYLYPFHGEEALAILSRCKRTVVVENNFSGQLARHLRAETGFGVEHVITRYDGEPFEPAGICRRVEAFLEGRPHDLRVQEREAREMAYHFVRLHLQDRARPSRLRQSQAGFDEPVWEVELVDRASGAPRGVLQIGLDTGAFYDGRQASANLPAEPAGEPLKLRRAR